MTKPEARPLYVIAQEIETDFNAAQGRWSANYGAVPYLKAMHALNGIDDKYGFDDAKSVVLYFLSNVRNWRGDTARRIKAELKAMVK